MDSQLSLSDDQKAKITPIIADRQEKLKALAESSGRRRKKAREMRSIMEDSDKKIEALLTNEQKTKYEQMEQERREQARERRAQRRAESSQ
jgi:Spy/CpxP family protein refolding chaperone